MRSFARWMAIAAMVLAADGLVAANRDGLQVRLSAASQVVRGDVDVVVNVTVTNTTRHPVNLLRWQLPSEELEAPLFRITRDGKPVAYLGPVIKRAAPQAADHVRLDPGASRSYDVELTAAYDLSGNGRYDIQYASRSVHGAGAATLKSDTLYLWLEGRSAAKKPTPPPPPGPIAYSNCSASQQTTVQSAVAGATAYAQGSTTYLSKHYSGGPRYPTWFGTYDLTRWNTVKAHFASIEDAFKTKALEFDCKCRQKYYAYVYPSQPYKIYLCSVFWSAPPTGTDSQAGTLIHEMSHFTVVADTDDVVYGQTGARSLALSDPELAITNADSHEYFAENDPPLQ